MTSPSRVQFLSDIGEEQDVVSGILYMLLSISLILFPLLVFFKMSANLSQKQLLVIINDFE